MATGEVTRGERMRQLAGTLQLVGVQAPAVKSILDLSCPMARVLSAVPYTSFGLNFRRLELPSDGAVEWSRLYRRHSQRSRRIFWIESFRRWSRCGCF